MKRKVAILGCSSSRDLAPYDDDSWEIWSCNEAEADRYEKMFELHPMSVQNKRELKWLKECKTPVYVLEETPLVPEGILYPLQEILEQPWADEYFTCTFAYQIALAIYEGVEEIGLWGMNIDIGSPRERTIESACIQHWLGVAKGKGIDVTWDEHPMKHRLNYGYDYWREMALVDNYLCRLAVHTLYRIGPKHICVGGDNEAIRKLK